MPLPPYMTGGGTRTPQFSQPSFEQSFQAPIPPAPPRSGNRLVTGGVVVALLAAALYGGYSLTHRAQAPAVEWLTAAPATQEKGFCLDASGSVDRDNNLSQTVAKDVADQVRALHGWKQTVPTFEATTAASAVHLEARLVRKDSFTTSNSLEYARDLNLPAVRGVSGKEPLITDDSHADWKAAYNQVVADQAAARDAQERAAHDITALAAKRSNGSDITGCIAALLTSAPAGASSSLLLVSDLQDNALKTAEGDERTFAAAPAGAHLTVIQACPGGVQSKCDKTQSAFVERMGALGIGPDAITFVRPEQRAAAIAGWLAKP